MFTSSTSNLECYMSHMKTWIIPFLRRNECNTYYLYVLIIWFYPFREFKRKFIIPKWKKIHFYINQKLFEAIFHSLIGISTSRDHQDDYNIYLWLWSSNIWKLVLRSRLWNSISRDQLWNSALGGWL